MIIIYGIKNCNSCKKALRHFSGRAKFRDIRDLPLGVETLKKFLSAFGPDLINTKSKTWRALADDDKSMNPLDLISTHPTVMKRPVIDNFGTLSIGWNDYSQKKLF
jgi:arsenate reductase-like glutaredoxin family protein